MNGDEMGKIFQVVLIGLVVIIAGVIGVTTYKYHTYKPTPVTLKVTPSNLPYFQESYNDCRKSFLAQAEKIRVTYKNVRIANLKIESKTDPDLTIDYCYIPAQKTFERLLIVTSGIHGVEGYVGSAVQQMFLNELLQKISLDNMGLLLIHGINPYGFKYKRRVTENNVDLNRNCSTDKALFASLNAGYSDLKGLLNPTGKANTRSMGNIFFPVNAIEKILLHGMGTLRQAVLQGQYQYPKGVYFGGRELEPSIKAVTPLIRDTARNYEMVFCIDLHTGYGKRGTMHLFPNPMKDKKKKAKVENIFSGIPIDWGDEADFYTVTGEFTSYVGQIIPGKYYLNMTFEFGTMDSQTTMGAIKSIHNVILENQGAHFGYASQKDEERIKHRFVEGYYPSSRPWRSKAIRDARKTLLQAVKKYQKTTMD
jgi:hypothetical protein